MVSLSRWALLTAKMTGRTVVAAGGGAGAEGGEVGFEAGQFGVVGGPLGPLGFVEVAVDDGDEDIRRLQVAMNNAGGMGAGEGVGERAVKNDVAFDVGEAAAGEISRGHLFG